MEQKRAPILTNNGGEGSNTNGVVSSLMKHTLRKNISGQGLMELIISLSIIIVALVSIISLVIMNLTGLKINENDIIARNLAREGIEVMRNLRDAAFLERKMIGTDYITSFTTNHYGRVSYDTQLSALGAEFNTIDENASLDIVFNDPQSYLFINASGVYHHTGITQSPFQRVIILDFICNATCNIGGDSICAYNETCADASGDGVADVIGYRVTSEVRWQEKGRSHKIFLTDFLYQWK